MTPRSILLIATRQIGDVLLATPLLRSLRLAWPRARIHVLVYRNKGGMLVGNPDCDAIIECDEHPSLGGYLALLRQIYRRHDLAITTQANDRGHIYALLAARKRIGLVPDSAAHGAWKRWSCQKWVRLDNRSRHTVLQNLALAESIGIAPCPAVIAPTGAGDTLDALLPFAWRDRAFLVVHPFPMWRYKRWTDPGWRALLAHSAQRGWKVVLTGGGDLEERAYCELLARDFPHVACSLAGKADFGSLACLLRHATAFIGPDTAMTHLAAACGTPTLALFGPSNPVKWGPWPLPAAGWLGSAGPWQLRGKPWQRVGNVLLLQGEVDCVPCCEEGCDRHKLSDSQCLQSLSPAKVITALEALLTEPMR